MTQLIAINLTVTTLCGLVLLLVVSGPMSHRPLQERVFMWLVAIGFLGASMSRLANILYFDPDSNIMRSVGYMVTITTRLGIAALCVKALVHHVHHPGKRTA